MQVRNLVVSVSMILASSSVALAKGGKKEPNCDVSGKKIHVKDEAACTKKKGVWSTMQSADAGKGAPVPVSSQTTPAASTPAPTTEGETTQPK